MSAETFWKAVRTVDSMPVQTVIVVANVHGSQRAGTFLAALGDDAIGRNYLVYPLQREGRARNLPNDCFIEGLGTVGLGAASRRTLFVNWDGSIYPSHHPGIPRLSSRLGDATLEPLAQILAQEGAPSETCPRSEV